MTMKNNEENLGRTRCEVYSRVVGFLSPVSQWNKGKQEEFRDRKPFYPCDKHTDDNTGNLLCTDLSTCLK